MGIQTYGIKEVVTCLGISRMELHQWVARDHFKPLHNPSCGKARKYTFDEIVFLGICNRLRSMGLSLDLAFSYAGTAHRYKSDKCPRIIVSDEISLLVDVEKIENEIRERLPTCQ